MILGPKCRFHYYAHLDEIMSFTLKSVGPGTTIGTVGDTDNAKGKRLPICTMQLRQLSHI
jgi:hypothetical protein